MSKNTGTSELINYFTLGASGAVDIGGNLTLSTITNATTDTDKFLVSDTGIIKYRTGAELLTDIGAAPATGGSYLPLAGGTLTGALNGTSATFSGDLIAASATLNTPAAGISMLLTGRSSDSLNQIRFNSNVGALNNFITSLPASLIIASQGSTPIEFITNNAVSSTPRMSISGAGIVTLTGALNGTSAAFSSTVTVSNADPLTYLQLANTSSGGQTYTLISAGVSNPHSEAVGTFYIRNSSTSTTPFRIASTGAATFSSSVTAASFRIDNSGFRGGIYPYLTVAGSGSDNSLTLFSESGANQGNIYFCPNGSATKVMTINTSGNVLIGTTTDGGYKLDVNGTGRFSGNELTVSGNNPALNLITTNPVLYSYIALTGGTSTNVIYTLANSYATTDIYVAGALALVGTTSGGISIAGTNASGVIRLYTNSTERMRIDSSGNVTFGVTAAYDTSLLWRADFTGGIHGRIYATGAPRIVAVAGESNGVQLTSGATSWTSNSDERLKDINFEIENAIEKLLTLRAVNFSWKADKLKKENLGLIAQDVEKQFPQLIDRGELAKTGDGEQKDKTQYLGIRYTELIPVIIKAIQEQQVQIQELKNKLS